VYASSRLVCVADRITTRDTQIFAAASKISVP
jgi:hypothetical protein